MVWVFFMINMKRDMRTCSSAMDHISPIETEFDGLHEFSFLRKCAWVDAEEMLQLFWYRQDVEDDDVLSQPPSGIYTQRCQPGKYQSGWISLRVGPFWTTGLTRWSGSGGVFNSSYLTPYRLGDIHAVSHYVVGYIDESNLLIGYPPIHPHHFHIASSGGLWGTQVAVDMQLHSDMQCHAKEGGTDCLFHAAPTGYAWLLRDRVTTVHEFNDIRQLQRHPLQSWAVVAFRQVAAEIPIWPIRQDKSVGLMDINLLSTRTTFLVPTQGETALWDAGYFADEIASAELIEAYFHGHPACIEDILFYQGSIDQVFHDVEEFNVTKRVHADGIISKVKASIARRLMRANAAALVCSYYQDAAKEIVQFDGRVEVMLRNPRCSLNLSIKPWVIIGLYKWQKLAVLPKSSWFPMHTVIRIFYSTKSLRAVLDVDAGLSYSQLRRDMISHGAVEYTRGAPRAKSELDLGFQ